MPPKYFINIIKFLHFSWQVHKSQHPLYFQGNEKSTLGEVKQANQQLSVYFESSHLQVLICISLIINVIGYLSMCLLAICMSFCENVHLCLPSIFLIRLVFFFFLILRCMRCLLILEVKSLLLHSQISSPILRVVFLFCLQILQFKKKTRTFFMFLRNIDFFNVLNLQN